VYYFLVSFDMPTDDELKSIRKGFKKVGCTLLLLCYFTAILYFIFTADYTALFVTALITGGILLIAASALEPPKPSS